MVLRVGAVAAVGAALFLAACGAREETRSYPVQARLVRVVDGGRSLAVDHEAIPGFMAAMQMTLPVRDPAVTRGLQPGDKIRFELLVSRGGAVIGAIEELPPETVLELADDASG